MSEFRTRMPLAAVFLAFFLLTVLANAQNVSSTINGFAVDNTGAVVPGALVTITNQGTGAKVETRTNTEGAFSMTGLSSGTYDVTITKEGFNTYTEKDIFVGPTVVR